MKPIRIATRQSPLALWQAEHVAHLLSLQNIESVLVPLVSSGDSDMRPIDNTRQVGLFTKRIQQALLDDEADIAVHSLKDLPTEVNPDLLLAAVPQRESVADCLVSRSGWSLDQLPEGARVGTGSRRRAAQLLNQRPDLLVEPIRGNVQTRLTSIEPDSTNRFDAIVLAQAGLLRLQRDDVVRVCLPLEQMLPAPGQGALGIEVRRNDELAAMTVASLNHLHSRAAVTAERSLLSALHGGCLAPIAAYAEVAHETLRMSAVALSPDGHERLEHTDESEFHFDTWNPDSEAVASGLAEAISAQLIQRGALEVVR